MVKDSHEPDFRELTILWGRQIINTSIYNFLKYDVLLEESK